jgi:predicted ABC-class ATPase
VGDPAALRRLLTGLDGSGYGGYKRLRDTAWDLDGATVRVERVQADPFAPPSRLVIDVPAARAAIPADLLGSQPRRRAVADHLLRRLDEVLETGGERSAFRVDAGGQQVLTRSACEVDDGGRVVARIGVSLPARGRRIKGHEAARLLADELPAAVAGALRYPSVDADACRRAADTIEDAVALRDQLPSRRLVAFVADGAILPRRSGIDDRPSDVPGVVPFRSPESLRVTLATPNAGPVTGMGVPEGVTLVVGGGFHGKSTLLRAIERGVYDHVPGDGRERVVARPEAAKVRAEDGRPVTRVDVSPFVGDLPTGGDTRDFSTANASGSTSQAAAIMEALEAGADTLLIDEDTSATNLMVRDERMRALVPDGSEPLTPFVDLVRPLHRTGGVSTILVAGGSGDYLAVADLVVHMDAFVPRDVTADAHRLAGPVSPHQARTFPAGRSRAIDPATVDPAVRGKPKVQARGRDALRFGEATIDLGAVEQLVDSSQVAGVGLALRRLVERGWLDGHATLAGALGELERAFATEGLRALAGEYPGDFALPRPLEVAAALNRLRPLRVRQLT